MRLLPVITLLFLGAGAAACGPAPNGSDAGSDAGVDAGPPHLPCAVEAVLKAKCRGCHSSPPVNGAPFPLLTQADFLAPYFAKTVRETAITAVTNDDMPLNGPPLPANEKTVLLDWLDAGVPLSTETCP